MTEYNQDSLDAEIERYRIKVNISNLEGRLFGNKKKLLELEKTRSVLLHSISEDEQAIAELQKSF